MIEVKERIWRDQQKSYIRILPQTIGISHRACSVALQRALSDFGFEKSFHQATRLVKEHYGFEINPSAVAKATLRQAERIACFQNKRPAVGALPAEGADTLIAEADGSFVRIVTTDSNAPDARKTRQVDYQEARLCAATAKGSDEVLYEATFEDVDAVGQLWAHSAKEAGWALGSLIHILADGACWIEKQATRIFGTQGEFLVDFYHVCEYLASAATSCSPQSERWMKTQKKRLKHGESSKVIASLEEHLEPESVADGQAVVRQAHRYLENRKEQLGYNLALEKELPIGSGLIESGHKHVIQARMKTPGASWSLQHAQIMIQARAFRANGCWEQLWQKAA